MAEQATYRGPSHAVTVDGVRFPRREKVDVGEALAVRLRRRGDFDVADKPAGKKKADKSESDEQEQPA